MCHLHFLFGFLFRSHIFTCIADMCSIEGKRRLCDLNVTSLRPPLATRHTLCAVGQ